MEIFIPTRYASFGGALGVLAVVSVAPRSFSIRARAEKNTNWSVWFDSFDSCTHIDAHIASLITTILIEMSTFQEVGNYHHNEIT